MVEKNVETDDSKKARQSTAKYPLEDLLLHCRELYGVAPEVVHGAVHGLNQTEFTISELKKLIIDFKQRKVAN